ncbi:unnamed protein product, partial [Darwinula stevensoni]
MQTHVHGTFHMHECRSQVKKCLTEVKNTISLVARLSRVEEALLEYPSLPDWVVLSSSDSASNADSQV